MPLVPSDAEDVGTGTCQRSDVEQEKNYLKTMLKKLSLLKLLKHADRRILRLRALAISYWKSLVFEEPPSLPAVPSGTSISPTDSDTLQTDAGDTHVTDVEDMDTDTAEVQGDLEPSLQTQPPDLPQKCRFEGLPKRLHVPAPKVLCRPSSRRWIKPCCTRSCGKTLEHSLIINYQK
ncbi:TP53-target gene 5 protein [Carettochelys insculpta]|uniref:TP53-target gene 5 protein n=1 Tax=Carettochelys insculpta TaxID=44489 RepID=UPI003EBAE5A9